MEDIFAALGGLAAICLVVFAAYYVTRFMAARARPHEIMTSPLTVKSWSLAQNFARICHRSRDAPMLTYLCRRRLTPYPVVASANRIDIR